MTITQLRYFVEVAESCSLRQTAERLYISQQALSKHIQALELEIGVSLFERKNQRIYLTKEGRYLLENISNLLAELESYIQTARSMKRTSLRIGMPEIEGIIGEIIPFVQACVESDDTEEVYVIEPINVLLNMFRRKEIDFLFVPQRDLDDVSIKHYSKIIKKLKHGIICSENHPLATKKQLSINDLRDERMFFFDKSYIRNMESDIRTEFSAYDIEFRDTRNYSNWKNMEIGLRSGQGIVLTYNVYLPPRTKELVFIPLVESELNKRHNLVVAWHDEALEELANKFVGVF